MGRGKFLLDFRKDFFINEGGKSMKKLKVDYTLCQGCGACELACSKLWFKEENPAKSAIRIFKNPGTGYNIAVCDQCGACMDMCSPMALDRKSVV